MLRAVSDPLQPTFKSCLEDSTGCHQALDGMRKLSIEIQNARAKILELQPPHCSELEDAPAKAEPLSSCGDKVRPVAWSRSIERPDLYCDAISWQFWEMGSSDEFRKNCPHHPSSTAPWVRDDEEHSDEEHSEL